MRWLLLVAAAVIVVASIPTYIDGGDPVTGSHAARHLGAWQIAFGVGLAVAGGVSRMSHALLALALTFAALTIFAKVIDVVAGHEGPWLDSVHLAELVGVFLLWRLTPPHLLLSIRRHRKPRAAPGPGEAPRLRVAPTPPQGNDPEGGD